MKSCLKLKLKNSFVMTVPRVMFAGMMVVYIYLLLRSAGIYPVVFADEWAYSSYSRLHSLREAGVPSYVYLSIFRVTNLCGDGFLDCVRLLNGFFIVIAIPLIYSIARQFCAEWPSLVVSLLSVAGPINTYAIYFMPEAMYFAGFWFLTWVVLTRSIYSSKKFALLLGLLLGFLSLVKIHALFLLPSLVCYVIYREWRLGNRSWLKSGTVCALMTLLSFFATKLSVGYLFAGRAGMTILGSLYGSQSGAIVKDKNLFEIAYSALMNFNGHVIAVALMFGLPLALILSDSLSISCTKKNKDDLIKQDLVFYTIAVFLPLLIITAYFTASVAGSGPYENISRLHMRYYNFLFPLFYILVLTQFRAESIVTRSKVVSVILVIFVSLYGISRLLKNFSPSMVDSPELRGFTHHVDFFRLLAVLGVGATIAWIFNARKAAKFFIYAFLPILVLVGSWQVNSEVRKRQVPDEYDEAGQFVKRYLGSATSQLMVVAPNPAGLLRTLFHIDNLKTQTMQREVGSSVDVKALPPGINWLLLINDYDVLGADGSGISLGKYLLVPVKQTYQIDFTKASWQGVLSRVRGLSSPEDWGTWSIGSELQLEFAANLPKRFDLTLQAHAFSSNLNDKFRMVIGSEERSFYLKSTPQTISFKFSSSANERVIRILVPHPTSPLSIGLNDDSRPLGIGLSQLRITPSN
jgi:phosphoglycerol transferase